MALDPEFRKKTEELVEQTLELYKKSGASPRIGEIWHIERPGEFLCGFFVGEMVGSALSAFQIVHKREPTPEEHAELVGIIEQYANQIRGFFASLDKVRKG